MPGWRYPYENKMASTQKECQRQLENYVLKVIAADLPIKDLEWDSGDVSGGRQLVRQVREVIDARNSHDMANRVIRSLGQVCDYAIEKGWMSRGKTLARFRLMIGHQPKAGYEAAMTRANDLRKQYGLKWDQVKFRSERGTQGSFGSGGSTEAVPRNQFGVSHDGRTLANTSGQSGRADYARRYNPSKVRRFRGYTDPQSSYHDID